MVKNISIDKLKSIKEKRKLTEYIPSNVYLMGSINYNDVYSSPSFKYLYEILLILPDDITREIITGCYFIFPFRDHGMHIPWESIKNRDIIVFNSFKGLEEKEIIKIMLHEIGHFYLKHRGTKCQNEYRRLENEAQQWAEKWFREICK